MIRKSIRPPGWAAALALWWLEKHSMRWKGCTITPVDPWPMAPYLGRIYGTSFIVSDVPPPRTGVRGFLDRQRANIYFATGFPARCWIEDCAWRTLKRRHPNKLMSIQPPRFHVKHSHDPDPPRIDVAKAVREQQTLQDIEFLRKLDCATFDELNRLAEDEGSTPRQAGGEPYLFTNTDFLNWFPTYPPAPCGPVQRCTFTPTEDPGGDVSRETPPADPGGDED